MSYVRSSVGTSTVTPHHTRRATPSSSLARRNYDHLVKTIIVGDSGVGKTCLLRRFSDEPFVEFHMTTIGVDFAVKTIPLEGKHAKLQIWDTAGQERFHTITTAYYRGADALLLVFDVENPESFEHCERWLKEIKVNTADSRPEIILVGNKVDVLPEYRHVSTAVAQKFAEEHEIPYIETSAKASVGVDEAFVSVASRCILKRAKIEQDNTEENVDLRKKQRKCNCVIL